MIPAFFSLAMTARNRQLAFRRAAVAHLLVVAALCAAAVGRERPMSPGVLAQALLVAGIVEGAVLIGWRMTQLPKSRALEFLLVSPLQPHRFFLAEAAVGAARLVLITLAGLPVLFLLLFAGRADPADLLVLTGVPLTWGLVTGLGLTMWAYEPPRVRRAGEWVALGGVLTYLTVGVLAGEKLAHWLRLLPEPLGEWIYLGFREFHDYNPFGVLRYWFDPFRVPEVAAGRLLAVEGLALALLGLIGLRGALRLKGHFHDRHYTPLRSDRADETGRIGDRPLSWWAVRRVMEYSGRVNIWLAGGFGLLYAAYLVAGDRWPAWMGRLVFELFERVGGAPVLVTGLVILAAVPAAFQYGLWDPTRQDRCRRLELLLLSELNARDYWHAAFAAALRRGRGYFLIALVLWGALVVSGRVTAGQALASSAAGVLLWSFSFAVGFRAFSRGVQANGLGTLLTLGLPLLTAVCVRLGEPHLAALLPPGGVYVALARPTGLAWAAGPVLLGGVTLALARTALRRCDGDLRRWYDRNQGSKALE